MHASRYTSANGWSSREAIEVASGDAFKPRVASNASGTVQAIWRQTDGMVYNIWANVSNEQCADYPIGGSLAA